MIDWITALLLIMGGFFTFVAGLGIFRLPDTLIRMHASTKAGTLGVGLIIASLCLYFNQMEITVRAVAIIIFLIITAPVAAHLIGRAAYKSSKRQGEIKKNRTPEK